MNNPKQIRALNLAMNQYLNENPVARNEKKNSSGNLLRSAGYIHKDIEQNLKELSFENIKEQSNEPLTSIELCSYNNWFRIHPEKQTGKEEITTSIHFPIQIKATKTEIIEVLNNGLKSDLKDDKQERLRITKVKAKAKLKLLKLK